MTNRSAAVALSAVVMLTAGCTATTGGKAGPAPGSALTDPIIKRAMVDGETLARMLGQPFEADPKSPTVGSGAEKLDSEWESAQPHDCVGVVHMLQRGPYGSAPIQRTASETWLQKGKSVTVAAVDEGIVELSTEADANALFAKFATQWQQCDGITLTTSRPDIYGLDAISGVHVTDSVVAAAVSLGSGPHSVLSAAPVGRALGVRRNFLVEVAVDFVPNTYPGYVGTGDINTSATDIAHAIMDRLSTLG